LNNTKLNNIQAVILAGGIGTRIAEETFARPKPMLEIGGRPIIWHIMKIYSTHGINDFIICCGYKGYIIKEYFSNYLLHMSDVTIDIERDKIEIHNHKAEPWRITLVDTGESTQTGGRLKRVASHIKGDFFCMTYGDGLASVNISESIKFHFAHGKLATMTAVQPPGRFGALELSGTSVTKFLEKPSGDGGWINGGYFVLSPEVLSLVEDDQMPWESKPLETLAKSKQLQAFHHPGFWLPMDTLRDKLQLEELWNSGSAPWKVWE
jgi:glucose-1-phosphate cytidylyltransferase